MKEDEKCNLCGGATFVKSGRVAIGNSKGEPSKYTRRICKKGCGWVGPMVLEGGSEVNLPKAESG